MQTQRRISLHTWTHTSRQVGEYQNPRTPSSEGWDNTKPLYFFLVSCHTLLRRGSETESIVPESPLLENRGNRWTLSKDNVRVHVPSSVTEWVERKRDRRSQRVSNPRLVSVLCNFTRLLTHYFYRRLVCKFFYETPTMCPPSLTPSVEVRVRTWRTVRKFKKFHVYIISWMDPSSFYDVVMLLYKGLLETLLYYFFFKKKKWIIHELISSFLPVRFVFKIPFLHN